MGGPETADFQITLEELLSKGLTKIVVDLKGVRWVNAAAIGVLVEALTRLREMRGDLRLARCCERTGSILHLVKMESLFCSYYDTPDTAAASFA